MTRNMGFALVAVVALSVLRAAADLPQIHTEVRDFAPGASLRIHFRAGDLRIVKGTDPRHIVLRYTAKSHGEDAADRVRHRFEVNGSEAEIELKAPNSVNLDVEVEVPSPVDLWVRMLAGDLTVEGLEGNKDVENHFGDITLKVDSQQHDRVIDASVHIGDVDGFPHPGHGWLGKSGKFGGSGQYRLHAHVGIGDVRLSFE